MGRKISSSTGLGPRFGSIVRKKHAKVIQTLKMKRTCPQCGSLKLKRKVIGIWNCPKCGFKIADGAYETTKI
ncbi:MAG: 50S ribosomal protein L37 [Thaumarchaeota archaeon]|nr:50S ribosomal protein L37 [Nitrososphaerota archaeon]|tara:strand:+ start:2428 stop:2643 length:216 start_codon:yes stop_codon:yes gene_type:complete